MTTLTQEQKDSIEAMIKEIVRAEIEAFQDELADAKLLGGKAGGGAEIVRRRKP